MKISDNVKFIVVYGLIIIACVLFDVFCMKSVGALELKPYDKAYNNNGDEYFGWSLPTRVANTTNIDNKVWYSIFTEGSMSSLCGNNCGGILLSGANNNLGINLPYYMSQSFDNQGHNIKIRNWVGTPVIELDKSSLGLFSNNYNNHRFALQFRPGLQSDTPLEFLDNGYNINYNSGYYYTYKFDIVLTVDKGEPILPCAFHEGGIPNATCSGIFKSVTNEDKYFVYNDGEYNTDGDYITNGTVYKTLKRTYEIDIPTFLPGMRFGNTTPETLINNNNNLLGYNDTSANGLLTNGYGTQVGNTHASQTSAFGSTDSSAKINFSISQPYDITYWVHNDGSNLYCQENCWTQEDSDSHLEYEGNSIEVKEKSLIEKLFSLEIFEDFGLQSIFINIFNKIKIIVGSFSNNTCYGFRITILGKDILLPCGKSFWTRNDIISFVGTIWNVVWTFFIGLFITRSMYIKLVSIFDFETGVVVDAKEISKL